MSSDTDLHLQLKKRARRRLLGAAALAALAVLVLPMVMESEPKEQMTDVIVKIPGQNDLPPLNPKTARNVESKPASSDLKETPTPETHPSKPEEKKLVTPETPVIPETKEPEKETPKEVKPSPEEQRAADILSGKTQDKEKQKEKAGTHIIKIGAYANQGNVKVIQKKLEEINVKNYTEIIKGSDGTQRTRLRAGPFPTKEAAEKALARMKTIDVGGQIATKE